MEYTYVQSEPNLWTVGYYHGPDDDLWEALSDHETPGAAALEAQRLNGEEAAKV
ncbi:hypothetical protein [Pseudomonas aeruginosa]|uniref:hypothetical protein n=1 Tax=Pseudomonas aeruginosa TaxID=287 RepID=UPI001375F492|nr:hypothetical protein [Pseudomonas aeruginosa]MBA5106174.1 hypothetical protein [Pseudomonas aeruginosa]MBD1300202.1 hypothetical protein [Pseudomonas aeruginosa]MBD1340815.1 hypothetical protein [Pseudomonas aeruginosa]MBG4604220.1 hypothetical protein [Pseudomonas aeruginosa]MBH3592942.1 hypothetical protein [Pseudomonas aeruginosa]